VTRERTAAYPFSCSKAVGRLPTNHATPTASSCACHSSGSWPSSSLRAVRPRGCRPSTMALAICGDSQDSRISLAIRCRQRCCSLPSSRSDRSGEVSTMSRVARASASSATSRVSRAGAAAFGSPSTSRVAFKPATVDVLVFLRRLQPTEVTTAPERKVRRTPAPVAEIAAADLQPDPVVPPQPAEDRSVRFTLFGEPHVCATAAQALVEILGKLASRNPAKVTELAQAVRGRSRSMIARTVAEINPPRPDLARAAEFAPGWLVGLNLSNRDKMAIIRTACAVFGVRIPEDLHIVLPNAP
jgi:hypothetical protein